MTTTEFLKNPNTKITYIIGNTETEELTESHYNNIIDSVKFFRRLGGTETKQMSYTSRGYNCTKLTSISPDRQTKIVRTFKFV
jgi:hypothetical protein